MSRPLRVEFPGAWFHVTARGNERRAIFRSDADRQRWLQLVAELPVRFEFTLHGYVLMPNHYHLIIETGSTGLSLGMQWLNLAYSVWFNRRHSRSGHLFQGRFKAVVVDPEQWGLNLSRYVHLNPVRTARYGLGKRERAERRLGLGAAPAVKQVTERLRVLQEFRWSSYRAYIGLEQAPPWLCVEALRQMVGASRHRVKSAYRAYVEDAIRDGIAENPWEHVQGQLVLGGIGLKEKVQSVLRGDRREQTAIKILGRRQFSEVVEAVSQLKGEAWEQYRDRRGDWGRDLALWLGRTHCGLRLRELGELAGGLDYAAAGMAIARCSKRISSDRALAKLAARAARLLHVEI